MSGYRAQPVKMNRRSVLRGAGGTVIGLPFLDVMRAGPVHAARGAGGKKRPKRFVVFFTPNGTVADNWNPKIPTGQKQGTETEFELSRILAPLQPHKGDLNIIQGLHLRGAGSDGHLNGVEGLLTGRPVKLGKIMNNNTGLRLGWADGISVDQRIANEIGVRTRFKSLELGVKCKSGYYGCISFAGPNRPLRPEASPYNAFQRVFGDVSSDPREVRRLRAERRSILDTVMGQFRALRGRVGGEDADKLDAHFESVRDIEVRLYKSANRQCRPPAFDQDPIDVMANENFATVGQLHTDILVMALKCDLTRVASLVWGGAAGGPPTFQFLGIDKGHHTLSHETTPEALEKLTLINTWYAHQFSNLISKLKLIPDGDGTLFDNCLLLWGNELADGAKHSHNDAPFVLAGSCGGALHTGRHLQFPTIKVDGRKKSTSHNDLLVSVLNAMDIPDQTFGNPEWCQGPLQGLA